MLRSYPNVNDGDWKNSSINCRLFMVVVTWELEAINPIILHREKYGHQRHKDQWCCSLTSPHWLPMHPIFSTMNMGPKIIGIFYGKIKALLCVISWQMTAELPVKNAKNAKNAKWKEDKEVGRLKEEKKWRVKVEMKIKWQFKLKLIIQYQKYTIYCVTAMLQLTPHVEIMICFVS